MGGYCATSAADELFRGRTFELEVNKKRNIVRALLTLRQLCKHQKPPPSSSALAYADTLQHHSKRIKIALRNTAPPHNTNRAEPFEPA